jgi:hypothetical protein
MDHDAMGRHVQGLLKFRQKLEELFGKDDDAGSALAGRLDTIEKSIAELGARLDAKGGGDVSIELGELGSRVAEIGETVAGLQVSKDEAESFSTRLHDMLTFFETNQAALEAVLSIGDGLVETDDTKGAAAGSGTGPLAAGSAAGSVGTEGSTATGGAAGASAGAGGGNAPGTANLTGEAAPVTAGPSDANAAPAAAAEPAAAEPAAGSDNSPSSLS